MGRKKIDIDFFDVQLEEISRVSMCTDGLSNMVEDETIERIISSPLT